MAVVTTFPVLDSGYVQLVETWGSDERIIEAARMSTNKGFKGWGESEHVSQCPNYGDPLRSDPCYACGRMSGDEKLLKFLYNHKHFTPFEMAGFTIEVQAPIFVFREWHRHRTQSYNELSARYTPLPNLNYHPDIAVIGERMENQGTNKQAQSFDASTFSMTPELWGEIERWLSDLDTVYQAAQEIYERGLKLGVPKELARLPVPVARYSRMRASANLRNWLGFLTLRMDSAAQWEIRQYANVVGNIVKVAFPRTWDLFIGKMK